MISYAIATCSLGRVLVAASSRGVCRLTLGDDEHELQQDLHHVLPTAQLSTDDEAFKKLLAVVVTYVDGPIGEFPFALDISGTEFRQRVWKALCKIPRGQTSSYAEVAAAIGAPRAVRAVGSACATNPIAVAIPCHRVLRKDGGAGGYRWGIERKKALLQQERTASASIISNR